MKVEQHSEIVEQKIAEGFIAAIDDAVVEAKRIAPHVTGTYANSIRHSGPHADADGYLTHIGATVSSARAKEVGAYITPKRAPRLVFNAGQGVRVADAVRLPARPVIRKVVNRWDKILRAQLITRLGR